MGIKANPKKIISKLLAISLVLVVAVFILLFVMSSIGGNSPALKQGLEQYLSQTFGGVAEIETLNSMTFYPYMAADVEGVRIYDTDKREKVILSADAMEVSLGFWDMSIASGNIKALNIVNAKAEPGVFTSEPLTVEDLGIKEQGEGEFALTANGTYNGVAYKFQAEMQPVGEGESQRFRFGDVRPFDFTIGSVSATGKVQNLSTDTIDVTDLDIDVKGSKITGEMHYELKKPGLRAIEFQASLPHGTKLNGDLELEALPKERTKITGDLTFDPLVHRDYFDTDIVDDVLDEFNELFGNDDAIAGYDFSDKDMDINVDVKTLQENGVPYFAMQFPVTIADAVLKIGPYRSEFNGATLNGETTLDSKEKPAALAMDIHIKNWEYGPIQQAFNGNETVSGSGDFAIKLKSTGGSTDELKSNMNGNFAFMGGQGNFPADSIDIWTNGLFNALLPDLSPDAETNLNCAIVDMSAEGGIFTTNAMFMDAQRVTIVGEGTYDLAKNELDIQLTPKPKSIAIGDVSTAVNVTGPIADPDVSPSVFSLGKKIGGLLLGGINPAMLAFTIADMGISEDHPCRAYVRADEDAQEDAQEKAE